MLTRLEVDGFKNLLKFAADFGPYTCIAGPNAAGKSNIFDAIEFLSLIADHPFMEAAAQLRAAGSRAPDPKTLFTDLVGQGERRMTLAAEMVVPRVVEDDFGQPGDPTSSFLRYEVELTYVPPDGGPTKMGRIALAAERLTYVRAGEASLKLPWSHSKKDFRDSVVFNRRTGKAYISTSHEDGQPVISVHQDGGSRGQPRRSAAGRAPRTVVSTTTTSDDPTILAARREMQSWRILALEPSAMRAPDALSDSSQILADGSHLAAALYRMSSVSEDALTEVAARASALTDVREVVVDVDPARELLTLSARIGAGPLLPARNLSDGTLRFLALCIILSDPSFTGLICMEEPENGIHPGRIRAMVELVKSLSVSPFEPAGPDNPFRQVIVNTHSPHFVQEQSIDDLVLALPASVKTDLGPRTTVRLLPMERSWRAKGSLASMTRRDILEYLKNPPGGQLSLDLGIAVSPE